MPPLPQSSRDATVRVGRYVGPQTEGSPSPWPAKVRESDSSIRTAITILNGDDAPQAPSEGETHAARE